jgi:uncharacterized peroxidase-related enzyme
MNRLHPIDPATAEGKLKNLLDAVQVGLGVIPNMFRLLANSPATLEAYLSYNRALSHGALPARIREQIALVVAETNGCDYCASAHTAIANHVGLSQDEITNALGGRAADPKADAAVRFAKLLLEKRGHISDSEFNQVKQAGLSQAEIAEIVAHVAINVLTNYFNIAVETEIDSPLVRTQQAKAA